MTTNDYGKAFKPNQPITRLEMARIIARALAKGQAYKTYLDAFKGLYNADLPFVDYRKFKQADVPYIALSFGSRIMSGYADASFGLEKQATRAEAAAMFMTYAADRIKQPAQLQYLNEFKEVAETGMNAKTVSNNMKPVVNLVTDKLTIDHPNYDAKVKRLYVMPFKGDTVSLYERKYFWDRSIYPAGYLKNEGYFVVVVDMTFKKSGNRELYTTNLFPMPSSAFFYQEPYNHFAFIFPSMKTEYYPVKGKTDEVVLYGSYDSNDAQIYIDARNATHGSYTQLVRNPK